MDSQIYPRTRRRIPRHAHHGARNHRQGTLLVFLVGAVVLGAMTLGSVAGSGPRTASSNPSFTTLSLDAGRDPAIADTTAGSAPEGPGNATGWPAVAPAACTGPPTQAPTIDGPAHPGAGASFAPIAAPRPHPVAVFLGDSYTSGYVGAGIGPDGWPAIVSASQRWRMHNLAVPGTGFVNPGWTDQPMPTLIAETNRLKPGVVVIAGGHNDRRYGTDRVANAADDVIDRLRAGLPDAVLVIVGPIWQDGSPATSIVTLRNHLRGKAAAVGAVFIDPLAGRWFAGSNHRYIGPDGTHPTNAGHRHIAAFVLAALRADPRFAPATVETPAATPTPSPTPVAWDPAGPSVAVAACAS